jgi:hypothetical protein
MSRGLKPIVIAAPDARTKVRAYLRSKCGNYAGTKVRAYLRGKCAAAEFSWEGRALDLSLRQAPGAGGDGEKQVLAE